MHSQWTYTKRVLSRASVAGSLALMMGACGGEDAPATGAAGGPSGAAGGLTGGTGGLSHDSGVTGGLGGGGKGGAGNGGGSAGSAGKAGGPNLANIIWHPDADPNPGSGDTGGNYKDYHGASSSSVIMNLYPEHGRPIQYGNQLAGHVGSGELGKIVHRTGGTFTSSGKSIDYPAGFVREGDFSFYFTVRNAANTVNDPTNASISDCDVPFPTCIRRRSQNSAVPIGTAVYDALPLRTERWATFSVYIDSDWDPDIPDPDGGPIVYEFKPSHGGGIPTFWITPRNGGWNVYHATTDDGRFSVRPENCAEIKYPGEECWQKQMFYGSDNGNKYPSDNGWPDGLQDYPNRASSEAALNSINIGGWTDWVIHWKPDHRGVAAGGSGFIELFKRENLGAWVKVLDIRPVDNMSRGGITFDRGISFNTAKGFGHAIGLYFADTSDALKASPQREVWIDNIKFGNENAACSDITHDGRDCTK